MGEGRLSGDESPSNRRLTVPQAAATLGITESAVRGRLKRGTLRSYRETGKVYVLLDALKPGASSSAHRDEPVGPPTDQSELVAVLREQLAAERQAHAEARRLLMAALERIPPQLEAPSEAPEAAETVEDASEGASPRPYAESTQEATQPRPRTPWWRRVLGR